MDLAQNIRKELENLKQEFRKVEDVLENDPDQLEPEIKKKNKKRQK